MIPLDVYPVGWLAAWKRRRMRQEWRFFKAFVHAGEWRAVRNTFNGYLAEHEGCQHNAGHGWTRRTAIRRLNRLCAARLIEGWTL